MYETSIIELSDTFNVKFPSKSVIVPLVVPFSMMVAPITGSPFASITFPVIFFSFVDTASFLAGDTIILFPETT